MTRDELYASAEASLSYEEKIELAGMLLRGADIQTDNCGQLIVYTGLFMQTDGSTSEEEDPNWED